LTSAHIAPDRDLGVFINCPFDDDYRPALDAIVFTCVRAGFFPWLAGSTGSTSNARVDRILEAVEGCRYSIHDLTRYRGEGTENLSRFNMPLELGMSMAARGRRPADSAHDWLVLVPEGHIYQRYVSDLAGFDPEPHDGSPARVAVAVLSWLMTRPTAAASVEPDDVVPRLDEFSARRGELDASWHGASPPWGNVVKLALEVARR
jgi:hypothetical protein